MAQATAPILDSTLADKPTVPDFVAYWTNNGQRAALALIGSAAIDPSRHWLIVQRPHLRSNTTLPEYSNDRKGTP